jgi:hypothetical protein
MRRSALEAESDLVHMVRSFAGRDQVLLNCEQGLKVFLKLQRICSAILDLKSIQAVHKSSAPASGK